MRHKPVAFHNFEHEGGNLGTSDGQLQGRRVDTHVKKAGRC